jgi:serine/threonine protein kinase
MVDSRQGVKVLDFGIAKLLAPKPGTADLSRAKPSLFSLSHASPEQLAGVTQTVGTDIYSLGVLLYQLLCGYLPFPQETRDLVAALDSRQRQPTAPSKAIFLEDQSPDRISQFRNTRARHLQRILQGDLDAIVLTALRTRPSERYPSIAALRLDLQRFLAGAPVEALPLSTTVRVVRWMRRNPLTSALLAVAFVLMAIGAHRSGSYFTEMVRVQKETQETIAFSRDLLKLDLAKLRINLESAAETRPAIDALNGAHTRLLKALDSLPVGLRVELERELYDSYSQAADSAWNLNHHEQAEILSTAAVNGLSALLKLFPTDGQLKKLYGRTLQQRIRFRTELGLQAGAAEDRTRLVELEATYDRTPE